MVEKSPFILSCVVILCGFLFTRNRTLLRSSVGGG